MTQDQQSAETLAALKDRVAELAKMAPDPGAARGPRVPPMSARKRRRRHVRDQRRANR